MQKVLLERNILITVNNNHFKPIVYQYVPSCMNFLRKLSYSADLYCSKDYISGNEAFRIC